ncbi:MAG: formylglycine-generating enzyme family protein, partial [Treponema sp.]|nr:formylglycine-generating enzyme family protein [Treponema sp.]
GIKSRGFMYAGSNNEKEVMTKKTLDMIITPTAVKDCNELGLYDMSGNVNEWISDFMGAYTQSAKTDPTGPNEPADKEYNERVVRGGGRIAVRKEERERGKSSGIGFRLVLSTD